MQKIKKISALETFSVRHPVLRNGKSIESCHFDGDNSQTTVHFGLYEKENLIGIVSLFEIKNDLFDHERQSQIRGMAVLKEYQKKGLGKILILNAEKYCIQEKLHLIWFNARKEAIGFYEKMGYKTEGKSFEIKDVGEHIIMFKNIDSQ